MKNVLLCSSVNNYASRCVLTGVQRFIERKDDWNTRMISFPEILTAEMVRRAPSDGFDGLLFPRVEEDDLARAIAETPLPVSIGLKYSRIAKRKAAVACVDICDRESGRIGARHFLKLGRFCAYAFAPHPDAPEWSENRRKGFVSELARHGIRAKVLAEGGTPDEIAALDKPCAVMAAWDHKAIEIMGYARKAGFDIPGKIAVVGVDADPIICGFANPPLTSVEPDFERMGYASAAALDAMMCGRKLKGVNKISCPPKGIVERASTYFVPAGQSLVDRAKAIIAQNAAGGLSVTALAMRLHVSPQLLALRFRQFESVSPCELIIRTRLDKVKTLLERTKARPSAIAAQCGFHSANRLFQLFKKRFGITMRDYRNRQGTLPDRSPTRNGANSRGRADSRA